MPTVLLNKKSPSLKQNIYQHQSKTKNGNESHGGVGPDKYANSRVHNASGQAVTLSDTARTPVSNTTIPRPKKHSKKRRLSQLATWVEDPIVFKVRKKARGGDLSMSAALREIILTGLKDEEGTEEALARESLRQSHARDTRVLASRLARLLVELLFDVGHINVLVNNILGMQKGMSEEMLKDILRDADRRTKASLSRTNPELEPFIDAMEKWLRADEKGEASAAGHTNGHRGKGGSGV